MCGSCGSPGGYSPPTMSVSSNFNQPIVPDTSCSYTLDQLFFWKTKLTCINDNNWASLINSNTSQVNVYLGWINSAINFYSQSPCYYKTYLDQIVPVINLVLNNTSC